MRSAAAVLLLVALVTPALAASLRKQCRELCKPATTACVETTGKKRACRKLVLRRCRREGLTTCVPPMSTTSTSSTTSSTTSTSTTTSTTVCVATSGTFCDRGDGTVFDTATGLQWEQKTSTAGLQNENNVYSWVGCCNGDCSTSANFCQPNAAAAATCAAQADGGTQGCRTCASGTCNVAPTGYGGLTTVWDWVNQVNAANFAGHSDWRLPSEGGNNSPSTGAKELETILLAPFPCETHPCIDAIFGPTASSNSLSNFYWSASNSRYSDDFAWFVSFADGLVIDVDPYFPIPKYFPFAVRAVR